MAFNSIEESENEAVDSIGSMTSAVEGVVDVTFVSAFSPIGFATSVPDAVTFVVTVGVVSSFMTFVEMFFMTFGVAAADATPVCSAIDVLVPP